MTDRSLALSVLDLIPVRTRQTSADAVAASVELARAADALGFKRYWLAEHHNMPSVAATSPPVLIGAIAAVTERIRVGSGGVMLPNHAPFVVAEQFAALEAIAAGRLDLGIGRAPGSDPVITALLAGSGHTSDVERFPAHVQDVIALLGPDGAQLNVPGREPYQVRATPAAAGRPEVWLLGSSQYSAELAARLGLPYVFANHFFGEGTEQALELYRRRFEPSAWLEAPRTFLTLNAVVAPSKDEAHALALPNLQHMARLRTGQPLTVLDTVEAARRADLSAAQRQLVQAASEKWVIDEPVQAAAKIVEFAERFDVHEVMVSPVASGYEGDRPDSAPGRLRTLELLAAQFRLG